MFFSTVKMGAAIGSRKAVGSAAAGNGMSGAGLDDVGLADTDPTADDLAVRLRGVTKQYRRQTALKAVSLTLASGSITGLVGPNGAGKTTLLKLLAGLISPTDGSGSVFGHEFSPHRRAMVFVGLMPEHPAFIEYLSGAANLRAFAAIRNQIGEKEIADALAHVGLDANDRKPVRAYSQGMRQRLSLAQAIMEQPRLLLLDEPANGLDPHGVVMLRDVVKDMAAQGCTVVLSSHLLSEVETVSERVLLIDGGRILKDLSLDEAGSLEAVYLELIAEHVR
ncbi:MAG: ABC transporter ATP-binding protein [Coriobacteriia bacterium]|nr:ABC transporter ATP-binding protein [Coriobacteriia bacterium]